MKTRNVNTQLENLTLWMIIIWGFLCIIPTKAFCNEPTKELKVEGSIVYKVTRQVKNQYKGKIKSIRIVRDSKVKKGQILGTYTLDKYIWNSLQKSISPSKSKKITMDIEELKSKIAIRERELNADLILLKEGMASQLSVDSKKNTLVLLQDKLHYTQQELRIEKRNIKIEKERITEALGGMKISTEVPRIAQFISPIDGNVLQIIEEQNWQLKPETNCFTISDTKDVFATVKIYVEDYPKLKEGMKATVTSDISPGKPYNATITKIPMTPMNRRYANLSYYKVELDIQDSNHSFRQGNTITVIIPLDTVNQEHQKK